MSRQASSVDETARLWRDYWQGRSLEARDALYARYAYLAEVVVKTMPVGPNDYGDCLQTARLAVLAAIAKFDPDRGVSFQTFATKVARGMVRHALRAVPLVRCRLPWSARATYERALEMYLATKGQLPRDDAALADFLNCPVAAVEEAKALGDRVPQVISLDSCGIGAGESERPVLGLEEMVSDQTAGDPSQHVEFWAAESVVALLWTQGKLTRQQTEVLLLVASGLSQRQIATRLNVSQMEVSRRWLMARVTVHDYLGMSGTPNPMPQPDTLTGSSVAIPARDRRRSARLVRQFCLAVKRKQGNPATRGP